MSDQKITAMKNKMFELMAHGKDADSVVAINEMLTKEIEFQVETNQLQHYQTAMQGFVSDCMAHGLMSDYFVAQQMKPTGDISTFCKLATFAKVSANDIDNYLRKIELGRRMSKRDEKVGEFMGMPNTFWNPCSHLDYNFYRHNRQAILNEFVRQI